MEIISLLSSSLKDRTEGQNKKVALMCIENPDLLLEIADSFGKVNDKLLGDCVEIFTMVAQSDPVLVYKYAEDLIPLLSSKNTRVRWEAMHSIALITTLIPEVINSLLLALKEIIINDKSVIVRDYAVKSISSLSGVKREYAIRTFPVLMEMLELWQDRHGAGIIEGLTNLVPLMPEVKGEIKKIIEEFENSERGTVRKAAKKLIKQLK